MGFELFYLTRFSSSSCRRRRLPKMATKPAMMKLMSSSASATLVMLNIVARDIAKPAIITKIATNDFSNAERLTIGSRRCPVCVCF